MRRIKHYCWNDTISTPGQHQTINANDLAMIHIRDYRLLLRVARAGDRFVHSDPLFRSERELCHAVDALNARKAKP